MPSAQKWAGEVARDSLLITFPGGFGKATVSDISVLGQTGLLLLLIWGFYAARREYHAVLSWVDFGKADSEAPLFKPTRWFPDRFGLRQTEDWLSAEHLAYAYHAVAQRFLFIFSTRDRQLRGLTLLLVALPSIVAMVNFITDLRDVHRMGEAFVPTAWARIWLEAGLLVVVLLISLHIARLVARTGVILNGWYLAVARVWMEEWDERTTYPASPVVVDVARQRALKATDDEVTRYGLTPDVQVQTENTSDGGG